MAFVCLFGASSERLETEQYRAAEAFGSGAARLGWHLVFGGANIGLMAAAARGFAAEGARIVSVIPRVFDRQGLTWTDAEEVILTDDLRERKRTMDARARAFVALPGGPGTADELLEVLTLRQIGVHDRPILLFNPNDYWGPLLSQLGEMHRQGFARRDPREYIAICSTVERLLSTLGEAQAGNA